METNFVYVVNAVSVATDWESLRPFFVHGFASGFLVGLLSWLISLVRAGLRAPRFPGGSGE